MKHDGVSTYRRRVQHLDETVAFYRDTLGFYVTRRDAAMAELWLGERTVLQLFAGGPPDPGYTDRGQAPSLFHLRTRDASALAARAVAAGGRQLNDFQRDVNHLMYVTDPSGGVVGFNERYANSPRVEDHEARRRRETGEMTAGPGPLPEDVGPLGYLMRRGTDLDLLLDFYANFIGFVVRSRGPENALLGVDPVTLIELAKGVPVLPVPTSPADVTDYWVLRVPNLDAAIGEARAAGIRQVGHITLVDGYKEAYILDPENQIIGLHEVL